MALEVCAHCDWSKHSRKRWMSAAIRADGKWIVAAPELVGDTATLFQRLAGRSHQSGSLLVGFDFPIGLPKAYAADAGIASFREAIDSSGRASGPIGMTSPNSATRYPIDGRFTRCGRAERREPISTTDLASSRATTCCENANGRRPTGLPAVLFLDTGRQSGWQGCDIWMAGDHSAGARRYRHLAIRWNARRAYLLQACGDLRDLPG